MKELTDVSEEKLKEIVMNICVYIDDLDEEDEDFFVHQAIHIDKIRTLISSGFFGYTLSSELFAKCMEEVKKIMWHEDGIWFYPDRTYENKST